MQMKMALDLSILPVIGVVLGWGNLNVFFKVLEAQQQISGNSDASTPLDGMFYTFMQISLSLTIVVLVSIYFSHRIASPVTATMCLAINCRRQLEHQNWP